jgi:signal recognition particle subunit SRP19
MMVSKSDEKQVLWPHYFDINVPRSRGRRVPKSLGIKDPKVEQIAEACRRLGLKPKVEDSARHSATSWRKTGRVLIVKKEKKEEIIKKVSRKLKESQR